MEAAMMSEAWTRVDLSQEQLEQGALARIREECCRWYLAARTPPNAQMVSRAPDARRRDRVSAELYFSPAMARICREAIASYHPVAASGSPAGKVTLLVGSESEPRRRWGTGRRR
jgi:hypothetical protein